MRPRFRFFNHESRGQGIVLTPKQALSKDKDIKLLRECVKKSGLKLKALKADDRLELFFDVYKGSKSICYVSKGWYDSGFRIGECQVIDKTTPDFKDRLYKIFNICSDNLISMGMTREGDDIWLSFEVGIYRNGLNDKVLKETISDFDISMSQIKRLLRIC